MKEKNQTYDNVFKTLVHESDILLIPLINEIFQTAYPVETAIIRTENELNYPDEEETLKRSVDSSFSIVHNGRTIRYHIECQSYHDRQILIRMMEYDVQLAMKEFVLNGQSHIISFPHSAILYLRSSSSIKSEEKILIRTEAGELLHPVHVMKITDYKLQDLMERKLYFLFPFYIFTYQQKLKAIVNDEERLKEFRDVYQKMFDHLDQQTENGTIDSHTFYLLIQMIREVVGAYAIRYNEIVKEVDQIMGGHIIDYPGRREYHQGKREGIQQGIERGLQQGIERGLQQGIEKGLQQGKEIGAINEREIIKDKLVSSGLLTKEQFDMAMKQS